MATIATNVLWTSGNPKIYFDFSYEKKRDGSTQYYKVSLSCKPVQGGSYFGFPIYVQIFLDGTSKVTHTLKNPDPSQWSSAITYTSGWLALSNKTSNTTALKIRLYSGMGSDRDASYNYSLEANPAASTISCTTAHIGNKPTITISRASSSFTHTVKYAFGSLTGTVATKTTATSITNWTIPESFYAQIPNAKTGKGTLTCTTYSGSTAIGESTCELPVTTDETLCKPTVTGMVVDTNDQTYAVTCDRNVLVRYMSTASCTIVVALNKSAGSIKGKTINNAAVSGNTRIINNIEVGTFDFYAKDSREYQNSFKVIKTLIPYVKLTNDAEIQRTDPTSGNAILTLNGNYFNGSFGATNNTLTVKYCQGSGGPYTTITPTISDNEYSASVPLEGLDYTKAFNFEVVVSDKLSSVTKKLTLQKGIPVFDWGEDDFNFNVPVTINGVNILEKLAELEALLKAKG